MRLVRPLALAALLVFSGLALLFGMEALTRFDQTAGASEQAPAKWPGSKLIRHSADRSELVVFVHPFCTCTVATLSELAQIRMSARTGKPDVQVSVLFYRPGPDSKWSATKLWNMALSLPGARALWDDGGREAKRFGAQTSGYALLYSADGNLLFHGGVTGSRGHEGDNYGLDQLAASMETGRRARSASQVFGCALGGRSQ